MDKDTEQTLEKYGDFSERSTTSDDEIREVFLTVWTEAVYSKEYNKKHWGILRHMLRLRGITGL